MMRRYFGRIYVYVLDAKPLLSSINKTNKSEDEFTEKIVKKKQKTLSPYRNNTVLHKSIVKIVIMKRQRYTRSTKIKNNSTINTPNSKYFKPKKRNRNKEPSNASVQFKP